MERADIAQGEDSIEVHEQDAREKRNVASPPNPRSSPAEPFPADRVPSLPPRARIPAINVTAAAAAAAVDNSLATTPTVITTTPPSSATAEPIVPIAIVAPAPVPMMSAPMAVPLEHTAPLQSSVPQQIILQPGQIFQNPGHGHGPQVIYLSALPLQMGGAKNPLQQTAHLQQPVGHGQVILQYPDHRPDMMLHHDRGDNSGYVDGPRHEMQEREWEQGNGRYRREHDRFGQDDREGGDGEDYGRRTDQSAGGDWDLAEGWQDDDHGFRGERGGRHDKLDRGRGRGARGRGRGRSAVLCVYFNSPGGCKKGDRCPFEHSRGVDRRGADGGRGRGERGRGRLRGGKGGRTVKPFHPD